MGRMKELEERVMENYLTVDIRYLVVFCGKAIISE